MARTDNRYSRYVAALKVILPLAALVLLSTLFLLARVPESTLPGRITGDVTADGRMRSSTFTTMTDDGPLSVTAEAAIPRASGYSVVDLEGLVATLDITGQRRITLTARTGRLSRGDRMAAFDGGVRIDTSDGYTFETESLHSAFDGARAEAPGPVAMTGPGIALKAGRMAIEEGPDSLAAGRVLFNGGVRLIYTPRPDPEEDPQ